MSDHFTAVHTFDAPVGVVWEVWVSPSTLVPPVTEVEMDPRVGGPIRISTGGPPESDMVGVFVVTDRQRLKYTWRWGNSDEETMVDVRFHDLGRQTVVEVYHGGFLDEQSRDTHRSGWESYFEGVAARVASA